MNQNNVLSKHLLSPLEEIVKKGCFQRGTISEFYHLLISHSSENPKTRLNAWKDSFQLDVSEADWKAVCTKAHTTFIHLRVTQYKWLMQTYVTPVKLNK